MFYETFYIDVEAASKLEMVSEECKKTEDVDIDGMLTNINQCIQCLNELADVETSKTRLVSILHVSYSVFCHIKIHRPQDTATVLLGCVVVSYMWIMSLYSYVCYL